jgi:DNA-binding GntR family transcriptional regulator
MGLVPSTHPHMPPTRAAAVGAELRRMIHGGELEPGARLRQAEIAHRFGVSTTPVREAFIALAREGLVRQDAQRGVVVFGASAAELIEIYELREILEPLATEIASKNLEADDLAYLEGLVVEMAGPLDDATYLARNRDLHSYIYAAARRPLLLSVIDEQRDVADAYISMTARYRVPQFRAHVQEQHELIVDALKRRRHKQAARAMRDHLEHTKRNVEELITRLGTAS